MFDLFATAAPGLEELVAAELGELGGESIRLTKAGVRFQGDLRIAYRCCLWSRLASRILLRIDELEIADEEALYRAIRAIPWEEHMTVDGTFVVDFVGGGSGIDNSHFGALRVKDAIVDRFMAQSRRRPDVEREQPDLRIHVHLRRGILSVAIDLAGESLHRRGYRATGVMAPLKESLAAALLIRAGWPELAAAGAPLVDPLCGSGTLPIEAAWIAGDRAPGLTRSYFGFQGWLQHQPAIWEELCAEAQARWEIGRRKIPTIVGFDHQHSAIRSAQANLERADLRGLVDVRVAEVEQLRRDPAWGGPGLVITNPPYGERIGHDQDLPALYATIGERLVAEFDGWSAAILTSETELGMATKLRARKIYKLRNGAIEVSLLLVDVAESNVRQPWKPMPRGEGALSLVNRLKKNQRALASWLKRDKISCYRLYDSDIPEYAVAVDLYGTDEGHYAVLQEYAPPATIDERVAARRLREAHEIVAEHFGVDQERVIVKQRRRQKRGDQYTRQASSGELHVVHEGRASFLVNLHDYLDTGLYLDHRPVRAMIADSSRGRDVLNLFCYTATATVHAALGGATSTTSVDLSRRYLSWAERNLEHNRLDRGRHTLIGADVRDFLRDDRRRYDLIYVDPPTFSNSKRARDFDVQREHVELIKSAADHLQPGGELIFSTHHRRFRLDADALTSFAIEDLSRATIPRDFQRNQRIHNCFRLRWI